MTGSADSAGAVPDARRRTTDNDPFPPSRRWRGILPGSPGSALHEHDYQRRLQKLLKDLDPTGRLTLPKISNWLFRTILTATGGDVAAASLITGKRHFLARVRGFYACYSLARLQQVYVQVVSEAAAHIRATIGANSLLPGFCLPPGEIHFAERHRYVGCRLAPTQAAVSEAISGLLRGACKVVGCRKLMA